MDHARALGRWAGRSLTCDIVAYVGPGVTVAEAEAITRRIRSDIGDRIDQAHHVRVSTLPTP